MRRFRVGRLFGIDVDVHASFLLLPAFFALTYGWNYGPEVGIRAASLVFLVFTCVLGHEFSHALTARCFGIRTPRITLYLIGGVASLQRIPEKPLQEFVITIAGPAFNFGLAAASFFPLHALLGEALFHPGLDSWPQTLANLFWVNPVLGAFNLVPAFPMDGGRLMRSLLAMRLDYVKATQISARIGRAFAILFILLGIWKRHWMLALIGLFVWTSAGTEERQATLEQALRKLEK